MSACRDDSSVSISSTSMRPTSLTKAGRAQEWLLLRSMLDAGFTTLVTVDRNLVYQQNVASVGVAVIACSTLREIEYKICCHYFRRCARPRRCRAGRDSPPRRLTSAEVDGRSAGVCVGFSRASRYHAAAERRR